MYDGERCDERIQRNINSPVFSKNIYNATVFENNPSRDHVLTVFANDSDHGRSGKVTYGLVDNAIVSYFIIDGETGIISTIQEFDYETLSQTVFTFKVIASDDGSPSRTAEATVVITIEDQNDNCPVFKRIPFSYNVPLKSKSKYVIVTVAAVDADSGKNGEIEYDIDKETNPDEFFEIGKVSGKLFVNKTLEPGKFRLTVLARDLGNNPCIQEIILTIVVDAAIIPSSSSVTKTVTSTGLQTSTAITSSVEQSEATVVRTSHATSSVHVTSSSVANTVASTGLQTSTAITSSVEQSEATVIRTPHVATSSVHVTSSPVAKTVTSTSLMTSTVVSTLEPSEAITPSQTAVSTSSSTSSFSSIIVSIDVRLTNKDFDDDLQNNSSQAYRDLRDELDKTLKSHFEKIEGFLKISSVEFKKGSVIAVLSVQFSGSKDKYYAQLLKQAIVNGSDSKGNIGELTFDIAFLKIPGGKTTNAPGGTKDDLPLPVSVIAVIGGVVLLIIIAAVFGVSMR